MLSDQDIFNRYLQKQAEFEKKVEVTLIGHSLFDMWGDLPQGTPSLMGKTVANLGISGVSTRQYLDVIATQGAIKHLGETVFFFLGVNDIVKEPQYSPQQVLDWLQQIMDKIRPLAPSNVRYFLLEATPVNEDQIKTVTNAQIALLNDYLAHHCPNELSFIPTQQAFRNELGWLADSLSSDGLHFSAEGYNRLAQLLLPHLTR